jgi:hypothetical protein
VVSVLVAASEGNEKRKEKENSGVGAYGLGLGHDGVAHGEEGQEVAHGVRLVGVLRVEGGQQLLPVERLVGFLHVSTRVSSHFRPKRPQPTSKKRNSDEEGEDEEDDDNLLPGSCSCVVNRLAKENREKRKELIRKKTKRERGKWQERVAPKTTYPFGERERVGGARVRRHGDYHLFLFFIIVRPSLRQCRLKTKENNKKIDIIKIMNRIKQKQ